MTTHRSLPEGDDGNAVLEFVALSVVVLIPFIYLLFSVFAVQRASFGATQAAREAGRVLATSDSLDAGLARARDAAALALTDQGVTAPPELAVVPAGSSCTNAAGTAAASLAPGSTFTVCVTEHVSLPYTDKGILHFGGATAVTLHASALVNIDAYRAPSP